MTVYGRTYKIVAILVCVGMLISLLPAPLWWEILGVQTAHATSTPLTGAQPAAISPTANEQVTDLMTSLGDALPPELADQLGSLGALTPEGEPNGMLMDAAALQGLPSSPPTEPAALANPISVSRVQSAYAASSAISNTLLVTFTVTNNRPPVNIPQIDPNASITDTIEAIAELDFTNDPNVIRNVLFTDELLPPQATFVEATPRPDHQNNVYAWNLGDIPPLSSVTMTLKLTVPASVLDFTELDTGATAWGTLQGRAVSDGAAPVSLAPDGYEGWLVCTIDANCNDEYVIEKAAELGNDPTAIFYYVRSLGFESYKGSLRGARGAIWSEAGNSTDQASLLIALLRASGVPAAYRHGDLEMPLRQQLILSMFPEPQGVIGHIPPGTEVADPANDPQLLDETRDHWWVQAYLPGLGWTHLDPTFASAAIGDTFVPFPSPDQLPELPDELRHRVNIRLGVENFDPIGSLNGNLPKSYPLNITVSSVELVGNPVALSHYVNSDAQGGFFFWRVFHTYVPYLTFIGSGEVIEGNPFSELVSNFPFGNFLVTGAWLEIRIVNVEGNVDFYERAIVDKLGYETRQVRGNISVALENQSVEPTFSEVDIYTMFFASSNVPQELSMLDVLVESYISVNQISSALESLPEQSNRLTSENIASLRNAKIEATKALRAASYLLGESLFYSIDEANLQISQPMLAISYPDRPRLAIVSNQTVSATLSLNIDLQNIEQRAIVAPGQATTAVQSVRFMQGMAGSNIEGQLLERFSGQQAKSALTVLRIARENDVPRVVITSQNLNDLSPLAVSAEAKARITQATRENKIVLMPTQMVMVNDVLTIGWLEISSNGYAIGVMESGLHEGSVGYGSTTANSGIFSTNGGQFLGGFLVSTISWIKNMLGSLLAEVTKPVCEAVIEGSGDACGLATETLISIINNFGLSAEASGRERIIKTAIDFLLNVFNAGKIPEDKQFLFSTIVAAIQVLDDIRPVFFGSTPTSFALKAGAVTGFFLGLFLFLGMAISQFEEEDDDDDDDDLIASFVPSRRYGPTPLTVVFTDTSSGDPPPNSWTWDFNSDGMTDAIGANPTYVYNSPGEYTVTLTVSNGDETKTITDRIVIRQAITAAFSFAPPAGGIAPLTVQFTDQSTPADIANLWQWRFGDPNQTQALEQNPTFTYQQGSPDGYYTVQLYVAAGVDEYDSTTQTINVVSVCDTPPSANTLTTLTVQQDEWLMEHFYRQTCWYQQYPDGDPNAYLHWGTWLQIVVEQNQGCTDADGDTDIDYCVQNSGDLIQPGSLIRVPAEPPGNSSSLNPTTPPPSGTITRGVVSSHSSTMATSVGLSQTATVIADDYVSAILDGEKQIHPSKLVRSTMLQTDTVPITSSTTIIGPLPAIELSGNLSEFNLSYDNVNSAIVVYPATEIITNGKSVDINLQTDHSKFDGLMLSSWGVPDHTGTVIDFDYFYAISATVRTQDGTIVDIGEVIGLPSHPHSTLKLSGETMTYVTEGRGHVATYSHSVPGLGVSAEWSRIVVTATADIFDPTSVSVGSLVIDDRILPAGEYIIEFHNVINVGAKRENLASITPSFTSQWLSEMQWANVQLAPGTGTGLLGTEPLDLHKGFAATGFHGTVTVSEQTPVIDNIQLTGAVFDFMEVAVSPAESSISPLQTTQVQIEVFSNATDEYELTVSGPPGWHIQIDNVGNVMLIPELQIALADEYKFVVTADSVSRPGLTASTEFTVDMMSTQSMLLEVIEEPLFTVPWGTAVPNSFPGLNDGRLQLPGAAFATTITNTSTVPHTFDVAVSGLPDGWFILSGAEGETETSITLPAGGVGQIGLYISPTVSALPPAGTEYPFTVTAVDTDGAGLFQTDSETFTVPAIAFNQVTADPQLVFAAPGGVAEFDLGVRNVGNIAGSFPVTLTLPISTWVQVSPHTSPVIVGAGDVDHQAIALNVPANTPLGRSYGVRVDSPAPGTAYVQTTFANVQIVSANALPIYQAAQEASELFPEAIDLTAALNFLALSIDNLEQSCQAGDCDLTYRDRVASGAAALAQAAEPISPLIVTDEALAELSPVILTHTSEPALLADNAALRDLVAELSVELQAIANHALHGRFSPGIQTVLENAPAAYDLHLTNHGNLPTTAVLTLTVTAATPGNSASTSWTTQSIPLQPGETVTVPTTITPSDQGAYLVEAQLTAVEASLIQHDIPTALNVVDALLIMGGVSPVPNFVEVDAGTDVDMHIALGNVANGPINGRAWVQLHAPDGSQVYSQTVPIAVSSSIVPLSYNLDTLDTTGLLTGTYTATVQILDTAGVLIPKAAGHGLLGVGQAVEADISVSPAIVTPGDAEVTVTIETELSQMILDLAANAFEMIKRLVLSRPQSHGSQRETLAAPALALPNLQTVPSGGAPLVVYTTNFESGVDPEWSVSNTSVTPYGYTFLGEFITETATLSLDNLPPHSEVTVSFDLFTIGSWDGVHPDHGPDIFDLTVDGGPTLLHSTFGIWDNSDQEWWQNYPDEYPGGAVYYPRTGSDYELGYGLDAAYELNYTFAHTATTLALDFAGINLTDETWGIDNVVITVDAGTLPICGPDIVGSWQTAVPLPLPLSTPFEYAGKELLFHDGRVYIFGGKNADEAQRTDIYASDINPDGSLAGWNIVGELPQPYIDYAVLQANNFVYLLTGADGQWDVWYTPIADLGQPNPWQMTTNIPGSRQGFGAAIYNNYLYIGGGGDLVQYVAINPVTGELGTWQNAPNLPTSANDNTVAIHNSVIYIIANGGAIYYAPIASDGSVGGWLTAVNPIPFDAHRFTTFINDGYLYAVGGANNYSGNVYYAPLHADGSVGVWHTTSAPLPTGDQREGMWGGVNNCTVYAIGGHYPHSGDLGNFYDTVYYATLQPNTIPPNVLLVDDDDWSNNYRSVYTETLEAIGVRYELWDVSVSGEPTTSTLSAYDTVIWFTGEADVDVGPSASAEAALTDWLAAGDNSLFLSSMDYHTDRGLTTFMIDHLGVLTVTDDLNYLTVTATGPLSAFGDYGLQIPLAYFNAAITGTTATETFFYTYDVGYRDAAIGYDGGNYRTTYWGFPFEALDDVDNPEIMRATLNWLAGDVRYAGPTDPNNSFADLNGEYYITANTELAILTAVMQDNEGNPIRHRTYDIQIQVNGGMSETIGTAVTDEDGELLFSFYLPDSYLDQYGSTWVAVTLYDTLYDITTYTDDGGFYLTPGELDIAASTLISLETPIIINEYGDNNYPNIELQLFLDSGLPFSGDYDGVYLILSGYDQYGYPVSNQFYDYPDSNGYVQFGDYDTYWQYPGYVDVTLRVESGWYEQPIEWYLGQIEYQVGTIDYADNAVAYPEELLANGIATTTITTTLYDYYGNEVPNRLVEIWAEGDYDDYYLGDAVSNEYGLVTFTFAWNQVEWLYPYVVDPLYGTNHSPYFSNAINFVAGPVDPSHPQNIIAVYPNPAHADEDEIIVDAELYTVSGHPADDYLIELHIDGVYVTDNYLDENGRGSFYFYWPTTGLVDLELYDVENDIFIPAGTIEILPGRIDSGASAVAATPPVISADNVEQSVITATLRDYSGNLVSNRDIQLILDGDVSGRHYLDTVTTDANGRVTFPPFSGNIAEIFTIVLYDTEFGEDIYTAVTLTLVGAGPADETQSDVLIDPPQVVADGVTTAVITATLRDISGTLVTDRLIGLQLDGLTTQTATTDGQGNISFSLTSTAVETITLTLHDTIYDVIVPVGVVEFVAGPVSATASQLVADVTTLTADGVDEATLTVTLYDDYSHLLPNVPVTISVTGAVSLTQFSATSNAQGIVTATVRSTAVQEVTVTAVADDTPLDDTLTLQFIPGPASLAHSDITIVPAEVIANGVMTTTIDATLRDALGHTIANRPLTMQISGSDNIVSTLPTSTDGNGRLTFTLASTSVELKTITVYEPLYDATLALGTANFVSGPTDPANSTVDVAPLVVVADGVQTAVITATLQDELAHPAAGRVAELLVDGTAVFTDTADANGVVVFNLPSTTLGTRQTAVRDAQYDVTLPGDPVIFVAGPADPALSDMEIAPNPVFAGGYQTATITVTIRDALNHPAAGRDIQLVVSGSGNTITPADTGVTDDIGTAVFYLTSDVAEVKDVYAIDLPYSVMLPGQQVEFIPGPAVPANSSVEIAPLEVVADGVQTAVITATLRDILNQPITGRNVQLVVSGSGNVIAPAVTAAPDANGVAVFTLASTAVEAKTIVVLDVEFNVTVPAADSVSFIPGPPDATTSQLTTSDATLTADGSDTATLTATLRDALGHPIPNRTVVINSTGSVTLTPLTTVTDTQGRVQATIRSTLAQVVTITATDSASGTTFNQMVTQTFVPGPAAVANSDVTVDPLSATADGEEFVTVTAVLRDAFNNPLANRPVSLLVSGSNNVIAPAGSVTADANGTAVFTVVSTRAQLKQIDARDVTGNVTIPGQQVIFVHGPLDTDQSTVSVNVTAVPADGLTPINVTVTAVDAFNNPIPGVSVNLLTAGGTVTVNQPTSVTGANGQTTGSLTAGQFGTITLQAVADGELLDDIIIVTFLGPELTLSKDGPTNGVTGHEVTYTLSLENDGPVVAQNVAVTDLLPAEISFLRATGPVSPTVTGSTVTWQLGDVAAGATVELVLVGRLSDNASLGSTLQNSATATSSTPEADLSDNTAVSTLTVVPGYSYALSLAPAAATLSLGEAGVVEVVVENTGHKQDTYDLSALIDGIDTADYALAASQLTLEPGEIGHVNLNVQVNNCSMAGTYDLFALAASAGLGNTSTANGALTLITSPQIRNLMPTADSSIGATSALFSWQTAVTTTATLFIRQVGSPPTSPTPAPPTPCTASPSTVSAATPTMNGTCAVYPTAALPKARYAPSASSTASSSPTAPSTSPLTVTTINAAPSPSKIKTTSPIPLS